MADLGIFVAVTAGLVSFLSPCILPIIPGFLSYLAGTSLAEAKTHRLPIFLNALCFVLGFSVVFAALGVLLNTVLEAIAYDVQQWLARLGGVVIIFFGLWLTGLIRIPFLDQEHKLVLKRRFRSKYLTSFVFGAAFAAGWTPCVGAVLGSILGLATTAPGAAFTLLMAYALGLGVPFLLVGLFASQSVVLIAKLGPWLKSINMLFGAMLVVIGILSFTQQLERLANFELLNAWILKR